MGWDGVIVVAYEPGVVLYVVNRDGAYPAAETTDESESMMTWPACDTECPVICSVCEAG